ncbi:LigA protein [Streptomyces himastatinicus ATCC 53653]|uniref:LigA protein n=1 Tax=Streptomyces himastatinicus ATCC 53653 TaxID=457427 RepID=D9WPK4_9ACTN|nr:ERF family protein [Streptomyces himastatinicus]EFL21869.1 LigA protein [Streptomyces himastatinicus ATCC 53653]
MTVTPLHPNQVAAPVADDTSRIETAYIPAPFGTPADAPRIFQVIHGVMSDVMPVAKGQRNQQQNYAFRGVDDAMSAMAGPMRNHGCFIAPEVVEHRQRPRGEKGTHTVIRMLYRIYGPAGDCLLVTVPGEAMDMADKSTNKAMSAALKYMLFQVFMIPIDARSIDDGDRDTPIMDNAPQQRQQGGQRHQRRGGQQRQQREQQPRRSNRAEPGPWEQPPAQQQAGARRDYLAEARKAPTPEAFAKVRAAAVEAGAPDHYLAELDQVAERKRKAAKQPQQAQGGQQRETPQQGEEHVIAVAELFDAARSAGVTDRAEVEQLFSSRYSVKPTEATVAQLREMRDDLLDAAKGASA